MMERLTIRNSDGGVSQPINLDWDGALRKLAAYEDTGLTPEQVKAQQWISVKDRLPDNEEDDVLIYCREIEHYGLHKEKRKAYHAIYKGAYDGDRWYTNWCYGCKYIEDTNAEYPDEEITVTHWMPLPEPPKEAQK